MPNSPKDADTQYFLRELQFGAREFLDNGLFIFREW